MKNKTKRYNFVFSDDVDSLLRELSEKSQLKMTTIIENAIKLYAQKNK